MISFDLSLARQLARGSSRAVRDRAFRLRAGLQGLLASCLCSWPIVKHETTSEHDARCPSQNIYDSMIEARKREVAK